VGIAYPFFYLGVNMKHLRKGFKKWPLNDQYNVEKQLQAYDKHLYLLYNPQTNEHLIMDGLLDMAVMKIPQPGFPELTSRLVDHIKKIHTANGFNASKEIQTVDDTLERRRQREIKDAAEQLAKDTYKATMDEHDYGRRLRTTVGVSK
jgi:hypothetical protein